MIKILDIGNTFTRIAEWDGGEFVDLRRLSTVDLNKDIIGTGSVVAACVCPQCKENLNGCGINFISALNHKSKVDFSLIDRTTVGADRVANAIAAAEFYPLPAVVIDCGTALTMEVVDEKCRFAGGAIFPGRKLLRNALASGTAQLPEIPMGQGMPHEIGRNTFEAIRFGIDNGIAGTAKQWIYEVEKIYGKVNVILTGGDAKFLSPAFPCAVVADDKFTLHGIRIAGGF